MIECTVTPTIAEFREQVRVLKRIIDEAEFLVRDGDKDRALAVLRGELSVPVTHS